MNKKTPYFKGEFKVIKIIYASLFSTFLLGSLGSIEGMATEIEPDNQYQQSEIVLLPRDPKISPEPEDPAEPEDPTEPTEPEDPAEPAEPDVFDSNRKVAPSSLTPYKGRGSNKTISFEDVNEQLLPKTGEQTNISLTIFGELLSLAAIFLAIVKRKKSV